MHHRFIVSRQVRDALGATLAALAFTCGCSLQDFSYLQKGAGGSNDGTGGGSNGGATDAAGGSANGGEQSGGTTNAGGTSPTGAVGGTATSNGGTPSGSSGGGSPASGGSSTAGGTSSAGGAVNTSATTSPGGTSSTGGGTSTGGASGLSTAGFASITNPGFETGASNVAPLGWTLSGTSQTASYILYDQPNAHSGFGDLNNWASSAYSVTTSQEVALPNGNYTLSIWYFGSAYTKQYLFARGYDSTDLAAELRANTVAIAAYVQLTISPISVTSGKVTIGVYSEGGAGAWSHFDDVTLIQIP